MSRRMIDQPTLSDMLDAVHSRYATLRDSIPSTVKSKKENRLWNGYTRGDYSQECSAVDSSLQNARDTAGANENGTIAEQLKFWNTALATLSMYEDEF
jgi:hypothetical protein